jgi:type IV pilus assembly protein PilX
MSRSSIGANKQSGAALIIVLLLLLAVTIPALAIMRTTLTNEKMAAAAADRARAFQSAEAALVEAESFAASKPTPPSSGCAGGICAKTTGGAPPWKAANFWETASNYRTAANPVDGIVSRYVIEFMGVSTAELEDCTTGGDVSPDAACEDEANRYRVTVRSRSSTGAEAILQTNYLAP